MFAAELMMVYKRPVPFLAILTVYTALLIALAGGTIWLAEESASARRALQVTLLTAVAAGLVLYAYCTMFSKFASYDDEGYMQTTIRHLLDGHRLYDDVSIPYGPFYYMWAWLVHGTLAIPLGNDSVRIGTLVLWGLSAVLAAWTAARIMPATMLGQGSTILLLVFWTLHTRAVTNEPGHPQVLVLLLVATGLLAGSFASEMDRGWALVLGAVTAGLVLTKANIGGLFCVSALLALVLNAPRRPGWQVLRQVLLAAALLLPAALMKTHLREAWAQRFCATVVLGVLLCWLVGSRDQRGMRTSLRQLRLFTAGATALSIVVVGFMLLHGSSLRGMAMILIVKPARFGEAFGWPIRAAPATLYWSGAGAALAVLYVAAWGRHRTVLEFYLLPCCKLLLVVTALAQQWGYRLLPGIDFLRDQVWPLHYFMGFLWLTLVAPGHRQPSSRELLTRRLLCFVAALQVLQMYPVFGTQMWVGTAAFIVIAMLWLTDALQAIEQHVGAGRGLRVLMPAYSGLGLLAIWTLVAPTMDAYGQFEQRVPVRLRGCRLTRMAEGDAALYQCLADTVAASADTFVCRTGLNSLYTWSNTRPAAPVVIGNTWNLIDDDDQAKVLALNRVKPRLMFIDHQALYTPSDEKAPFLRYVHEEFRPVARLGGYTLMVRPERADVRLRSCAWLVTDEAVRRRAMQAAAINGLPTMGMQVLRLSIPQQRLGEQVTRVRLIDLGTGAILSDTAARDWETRAILLDEAGQPLLPSNPDTLAVRMPADPEAWGLAIPASIDVSQTNALSFPALQFYDRESYVMTIPVAVGWVEPTARH